MFLCTSYVPVIMLGAVNFQIIVEAIVLFLPPVFFWKRSVRKLGFRGLGNIELLRFELESSGSIFAFYLLYLCYLCNKGIAIQVQEMGQGGQNFEKYLSHKETFLP